MDILKRFSLAYSNWIGGFPPAVQMLLLRWALALVLTLVLGLFVRSLKPPFGTVSLVLQITAVVAAGAIALAASFEAVCVERPGMGQKVLLSAALFAWLVLPRIVPQGVIRRLGYQRHATVALYAFEGLLMTVQWLYLL